MTSLELLKAQTTHLYAAEEEEPEEAPRRSGGGAAGEDYNFSEPDVEEGIDDMDQEEAIKMSEQDIMAIQNELLFSI